MAEKSISASPQPSANAWVTLTHHDRVSMRAAMVHHAFVCWIRHGSKTLYHGETPLTSCTPDQLLLVNAGQQIDFCNYPVPRYGYQAHLINLDYRTLQHFYHQSPHNQSCKAIHIETLDIDATLESVLQRLASIGTRSPSSLFDHWINELLLLISLKGFVFRPRQNMSIQERIHQHIGHRLEQKWQKKAIADLFHVSERTLDRQLAQEGQTFSSLLRQWRMEQAMSLLLQHQHSIGEIAYRCGYQSHSRFSQTFKAYFGKSPADIH
ncbi:helix-turn-helix transcriptional regulator [Cardiobacteriaceae bacterium TAE3-ERU3]|nr:helix-turn-helix transcriptional regulator [Cardiobacteriaceae bacterium TAE3-ERU3]